MSNNQQNQPSPQILIYQSEDGKIKLDVELQQETVWLNQEQMAVLFGKARSTIAEHIQNIFKEGELEENLACRNFRHTTSHGAIKGKTQENDVKYYNLDVIISVGYRVKSKQGTQFRIWATNRLKEYIVKGFALNDDRFKAGKSMNYFDELQERIREIRLSERFFYQKIKDIYATSIDYDAKDEKTIEFFQIVQNKLLWAISKQTETELIYKRSDGNLPFMGMKSYDKKTEKSITKKDSEIGKIVSDYIFDKKKKPYSHIRKVEWIEKEIPRTSFDQDLLYSFGAFKTFCEINRNDAESRIKSFAILTDLVKSILFIFKLKFINYHKTSANLLNFTPSPSPSQQTSTRISSFGCYR